LKIASNRVKDAGFEALGCAAAFCSGSPLMEMVRDKSLEEAEQMTEEHIISFLRGIPEQKFHCTCLARKTLELAIRKFRNIETSSKTD
jgi:NifU-like protein involved in Fe-S cluster formation